MMEAHPTSCTEPFQRRFLTGTPGFLVKKILLFLTITYYTIPNYQHVSPPPNFTPSFINFPFIYILLLPFRTLSKFPFVSFLPLISSPILSQNTQNHNLSIPSSILFLTIHISCKMTKYGGAGRNCWDGGGGVMEKTNSLRRPKLATLLRSEPDISINREETSYSFNHRNSNASAGSPAQIYNRSPMSGDSSPSPYFMSPWNQTSSPYTNSPWIRASPLIFKDNRRFLIGSLLREEGHVYALAASGDLLYTGSDSKNIRVWKNLKDFSGFKSNSGLVKAIVISGEKIFTGHQDGKIRVWKLSPKKNYKRVGSLPTTRDFIKSSFNPKNYVEVRRHRNVPWIKHFDTVSCMSLDKDRGLLYSGSWDKTIKVWRIRDSKCLESVKAHDDAVNSVVVAGFDGLVLTGSADGTVKVWRKELMGRKSKHVLVQVLLKQENAVTALAVNVEAAVIYGGSSDGLLNFWEREKHLCHGGVLRGHKMAVLCLATAGNMVFSGSADKSICVWGRDKGGDHTCLSVLTGHCGPVKCLAVEEDQDQESSNGDDDRRWIVYSGSLDKSVKVWRMSDHVAELE